MDRIEHLGKTQLVTGVVLFLLVWLAGLLPLERLLVGFLDQYNAEVLKDTVIQFAGAAVILVVGR